MKIFLTILVVLILIAAALIGFFVVTFDADSYRPVVISKLESVFQKPVDLQGISLTWNDGIALKLTGLAVYPGKTKEGDPAARFDEASTLVKFFPLLQKDIQITALKLIRPSLHLLRTAEGEVMLYETQGPEKTVPGQPLPDAVKAGPQAPKPAKPSGVVVAPLVPIFIDSLEIEDGSVRFTDKTGEFAQDLFVDQVDISLKDVSYSRTIPFKVDFAVFSRDQNVHLKGKFRVDIIKQTGVIERLDAQTDLNSLDWSKVQAAFPVIQTAGLRDAPKGQLRVEADNLRFDAEGAVELNGKVIFREGRLSLADIQSPFENIQLEVQIEKEKIQIKNFSLQAAHGSVSGVGAVEHLSTAPQAAFEMKAEHLNLDELLPKPDPDEPSLSGLLTVSFQGTASGKEWPQISQSLSGQGQVALAEGVLRNLNVIQEVFKNLSVIPGLVDKLKSRLPENYEEKLSAKDTVLNPIQFPVSVQRGVASVRDLQISSDTFNIRGTGAFGLDGRVDMQTFLTIDPDLSQAFIKSVQELQYLTNPEGQLQVPIRISGVSPDVRVMPDVPYVASKLAVSKTQEVIGKILEKQMKKEPTPQEGAPGEAPQDTKKPDLWGQLLETALESVGPKRTEQPVAHS